MNTKLAVSLLLLIVVACGAYAYWGMSRPSGEPSPIVERDGLYYVGDKTLGQGYVRKAGGIFYAERMQYGDNQVRYDQFPVVDADPATFTLMTTASSSNSESVSYLWGKDSNNVFYEGQPVRPLSSSTPAIDTTTFSVIPNNYYAFGRDKNAVYEVRLADSTLYEELAGVDSATFAFVEESCAEDKNAFYTIGYYGEFATSTPLTPAACAHPGP